MPAKLFVYKILRPAEWDELVRSGAFAGSEDDIRDGYMHLSSTGQIEGTLNRHFSGPLDFEVVLAAVPIECLGSDLRWERSRGGQLFPHLYAGLRIGQVAWWEKLMRDGSGGYRLPDRVFA